MKDKYQEKLGTLKQGETFRKKTEVQEPSYHPYVSRCSEQIIQRARSQGYISCDEGQNITSQLKSARDYSRDSRAAKKLQNSHSQSFLGHAQKNTDRYAAVRLHREFEGVVLQLNLGP